MVSICISEPNSDLLTWRMAKVLSDPFSEVAQVLARSLAVAEVFSWQLSIMAEITDNLFQHNP